MIRLLTIIPALTLLIVSRGVGQELQSGDISPQTSLPLELEVGGSYEHLTRGYADWWSSYLEVTKKISRQDAVTGILQQTDRHSLKDQQVMVGAYLGLGPTWTAYSEASYSPSHNVLPIWSFEWQAQVELARGIVGHLGLRQTQHMTTGITQGIFEFEYYWQNFRVASRISAAIVPELGTAVGNHATMGYYYDERNSISIGLSVGGELENRGAIGVVRSDVYGVNGSWRHWLSANVALSSHMHYRVQGSSYSSRGVQLGLRYVP